MDDTKLLFLCQNNQAKKPFVKFTRKYCKAAYEYCTANGVALELYAAETLPGGWFMVAMEYLDDESYQLLLTSSVNRVDLALEVRRVVGVLHAGGFVHGDIRDVNLMVRRKWSDADNPKNVLLVDFDWAGPEEDARYPPNVNYVDISRPDGAKDGELITQEHDQTMVDKMVP
jgi:serine/threonine protein kinase